MGSVLCFISEEFADFEVTLALHKIRNVGKREVITVAYERRAVKSESGLTYEPDFTIKEAMRFQDIEGLLIPGGPLRGQAEELTALILKLEQEGKMLAAICNGPQYLGRAGVLERHKFTTSCSPKKIRESAVNDPFPWQNYLEQRVVIDRQVITAKGRAFVDFSFAVFDLLGIYRGLEADQNELFTEITEGGYREFFSGKGK